MADLISYGLPDSAVRELEWSYRQLEHPSLAARLSDVLASPFEEAMKLLPRDWRRWLDHSAETSMRRTLSLAVGSMPVPRQLNLSPPSRDWAHKVAVAGAGAVGGFFGPLSTLAELPFATGLMMRSIASIARSEGEDPHYSCETRLACVQVFALGGRTQDDEAAEIGYYGMRLTLGLHFESVVEFVGSAEGPHVPAVIQIVRAIAARFGVVVSDKVAAQMVPVAGALSGAALNLIFMQHYQDVARGHFIVRRLEREYGADRVRDAYHALRDEESVASREFSPVEGW
ncbi:MAG: EcsC family protein [Thiohalocapsa sp.]